MNRSFKMKVSGGEVTLSEGDDGGTIMVRSIERGFSRYTSATLTASELHALAVGILEWFDATVLNVDQQRARSDGMREAVDRVLIEHGARCLDDDVDRKVVTDELLRAIQ